MVHGGEVLFACCLLLTLPAFGDIVEYHHLTISHHGYSSSRGVQADRRQKFRMTNRTSAHFHMLLLDEVISRFVFGQIWRVEDRAGGGGVVSRFPICVLNKRILVGTVIASLPRHALEIFRTRQIG